MKMDIISRGKKYRNPAFEIPREDRFVFKEEQKKSNLKRHHMLYRRLQYYMVHKLDGSYEPPVYKSVFNCAHVVIGLTPSRSREVRGDGWIG